MSLQNIERMLRQSIGLQAESVGRSAISSAVGRRMAVLDLGSIREYVQHLSATDSELSELIETVVIPETWFFRDSRPFQVLKRVAAELNAARRGLPLRALSVPCSTGEEPYSIVMTLLEAGLPPAQIQVDAIDVSRRALQFAQTGSYGSHSFRGEQDPAVLARYFQREGARYRICESVRERVQFRHGNLLDPTLPASEGSYDVVFCRNLMIYFDEQAKRTAYGVLQRALAAHGLLFVGHAECGTVPASLFHSAGHAFGFAFRKGPAPASRPEPRRPAPPRKPRSVSTPAPKSPPAAKAPAAPAAEGHPLESARQLADLGRLAEARDICKAHIHDPDRNAEAYFLLGIVEAAESNADTAEDALRKALYLQPRHYEALVQLALLLEQRGDRVGAARLRQRADRAAPSSAGDQGA